MLEQIAVFVENKAGRLCDIMQALHESGVNLRALNIADTADFGIVRLIADNTTLAQDTLRKEGFAVKVSRVIGVSVPDKSGELLSVIRSFEANGVNIEYSYSLLAGKNGVADIVLSTSDNDKAKALLTETGVNIISPGDLL